MAVSRRKLSVVLGLAVASAGLLVLAATPRALSPERLFNAISAESGIVTHRGLAYGPGPRHRLDIYRAPAGRERRALVVFYYGGGWTEGERATYAFVANALAARGYTTVVPDYRLFPEVRYPDFLDDAVAAYRWTRSSLAGGCGAPRPVVVMGHSAGAYIAAMVALDGMLRRGTGAPLPAPAALIGLAGPYAFDPTTWPSTKAIFAPAAGRPDRARPVAFVRGPAPPALIMHGSADTIVQLYNSRDLVAVLRASGNVAVGIEYPRLGHVGLLTAIARPLRWRGTVLDDIADFIERHAGGEAEPEACAGPPPVRRSKA
ncbi:MAG TPA: alpha/beta hydrolase [Hyphomicrobiaceae bacterium]|nr:alpha/beta hydrolase [Hyphomicrobiaceae bacterium]